MRGDRVQRGECDRLLDIEMPALRDRLKQSTRRVVVEPPRPGEHIALLSRQVFDRGQKSPGRWVEGFGVCNWDECGERCVVGGELESRQLVTQDQGRHCLPRRDDLFVALLLEGLE